MEVEAIWQKSYSEDGEFLAVEWFFTIPDTASSLNQWVGEPMYIWASE